MTDDERALIAAAVAGDRDAFGALYERSRPTVLAYITHRVRNRPLAEDLTQDVFRRALVSMCKYEDRGYAFEAFVITIARNLVADYYKGAAFRTTICSSELVAEPIDADRWVDPERCVTHGVIAAEITAALARLNVAQRMCVELRFLRGMSVAETAAAMGKNQGAIKALLQRATSALRRDPAVEALR